MTTPCQTPSRHPAFTRALALPTHGTMGAPISVGQWSVQGWHNLIPS
jgi:hypothetical protein